MEFHPFANILPLLVGAPFDEMVASIRANGQRDVISTYEDKILDGRNRYNACIEAGIEPRFTDFVGNDDEARKFVIDKNITRRQLKEAQKAFALAALCSLPHGTNQFSQTNQKDEEEGPAGHSSLTLNAAAKQADVGRKSVQRAKLILIHGTEAEKSAVKNGKAGLYKIAKDIATRTSSKPMAEKPKSDRKRPETHFDRFVSGGDVVERIRAVQDKNSGDAALALGLPKEIYRRAADIVLLVDRADLNPVDVATVQDALSRLKTGDINAASYLTKDLKSRLWGKRGQRKHADNKRIQDFERRMVFLRETCEIAAEVVIPYLTSQQLKSAEKAVMEAQAGIRILLRRLRDRKEEEGVSHNDD